MPSSAIKTFVKQFVAFCAVSSGVVAINRRKGAKGRLTILMYHRVTPERDVMGLSVSPEFFDRQLKFIASRFNVISLEEAVQMLPDGLPPGEHAVITFDDGYRDNYDFAYPLLRKHQLSATIFVTVDALETGNFGWHSFDQAILHSSQPFLDLTEYNLGRIGIEDTEQREHAIKYLHGELKRCSHDKRLKVVEHVVSKLSKAPDHPERVMLNWEDAREMQQSGLVTIASHTLTHPILTRIDREKARDEIARSKSIIEQRLGAPVILFAYPNGTVVDYDDEIIGMLKAAGYSAACTTTAGSAFEAADLYRLPRVDVTFGMCEGIGGAFSSAMFEFGLCFHGKR